LKKLGTFELTMKQGLTSRKKIPVEVFLDYENTILSLDVSCCPDFLARRLPGGALIPIASALKSFFEEKGMRNVDVSVQGSIMLRTYRGIIEEDSLPLLEREMQIAVEKFTKKGKGK
jgi:hypothetical protein